MEQKTPDVVIAETVGTVNMGGPEAKAPKRPTGPPPITEADIDARFGYVEPTPERAARHTAVGLARDRFIESLFDADRSFASVQEAVKTFAKAIINNAPNCVDTTAAVRNAALARNAANDFLRGTAVRANVVDFRALAIEQAILAAYQANTAIALAGR